MSNTLISELRVALAGDNLAGLSGAEASRKLPDMDVEAIWSVRVAEVAEVAEFTADSEAVHPNARAAMDREWQRRLDNGTQTVPLDAEAYIEAATKAFHSKWGRGDEDRRAEVDRMRHRLRCIDRELQERYDRGEMPRPVAELVKQLLTAAREVTHPAKKVCKSCGAVELLGDVFEARRRVDALRERIQRETGICVRATLAKLAAEA